MSIAEFGLFATASATGIVISRIAGLGFSSPLYRIATVKPPLIGVYTSGYLAALLVSLPLALLVGILAYFLVFAGDMGIEPFALIILAETLLWRSIEIVMIVCNEMGRFGRSAVLVVIGSAIPATAAIVFSLTDNLSLETWTWYYLAAIGVVLVVGILFFYPRCQLRWHLGWYLRRWRDSLAVARAEILFCLQSELDRLLVLSIGGPVTAGLYAIIMRLVDLTAPPIRSFNMMLVQMIMRSGDAINSVRTRVLIELGIAFVSTAALLFFAGFLTIYPTALGQNVAKAAPLLIFVAAVPALRNLIEYHSELLYVTARTFVRTINLAVIGLTKAVMLAVLLASYSSVSAWTPLLNGAFLVLYLLSFLLTYPALRGDTRRGI